MLMLGSPLYIFCQWKRVRSLNLPFAYLLGCFLFIGRTEGVFRKVSTRKYIAFDTPRKWNSQKKKKNVIIFTGRCHLPSGILRNSKANLSKQTLEPIDDCAMFGVRKQQFVDDKIAIIYSEHLFTQIFPFCLFTFFANDYLW